jgi:hypothetical protein
MEWRDIPGWPGYQINRLGKVRTSGGYELHQHGMGYRLYRDGRRRTVLTYYLLALAFAPAPVPAPAPESENAEFRPVTHLPGLEIDRTGRVRKTATGRVLKHGYQNDDKTRPKIVCICSDGVRRGGSIAVLLEEAFGEGAAQAAGLPAPRMELSSGGRRAARAHKEMYPTRRCATCGKPTTDYRCPACWIKLRGFTAEEAAARDYIEF